MKASLLTVTLLASMSISAFASEEDFYYEPKGVLHEMQLACVATKAQCLTLAQQGGYEFLRILTDSARCPSRSKSKACIVKH